MRVTSNPDPFDPAFGYTITVSQGLPPYDFSAGPVPPNPPGVTITVTGDEARVMVPSNTPPGTPVTVIVSDSGTPPATAAASSKVA